MASGAVIDGMGFPAAVTLYGAVGGVFTVLIGLRWRAKLWQA